MNLFTIVIAILSLNSAFCKRRPTNTAQSAPLNAPPTTPARTLEQTADVINRLSISWKNDAIEKLWPEDILFHDVDGLTFKPLLFSGSEHDVAEDKSTWILESERIVTMYNSLDQRPGSPITHMGVKFGNGLINVFECNPDGSGQAIYRGDDWVTPGYNVYEIRMRIPKDLCPDQLASKGYCATLPLRFYAMWFTGGEGARQAHASTSFDTSTVEVFCGSSCEAPTGTPCAYENQCQKGCSRFGYKSEPSTASERNRQISRRYDVGRYEGILAFDYTTGASADRISIFHDNRRIFDSGCVATGRGRWAITKIPFKGQSTAIRVDVETNCDGDSASFRDADFEYKFPQLGGASTGGSPCLN